MRNALQQNMQRSSGVPLGSSLLNDVPSEPPNITFFCSQKRPEAVARKRGKLNRKDVEQWKSNENDEKVSTKVYVSRKRQLYNFNILAGRDVYRLLNQKQRTRAISRSAGPKKKAAELAARAAALG